jgi:quinol monooxygenase YgiN
MIHVIATITVHPGRRAEFLEHFHRLMPLVHAETGCLEYGPAIDIHTGLPNPVPLREDVVVIVEKWENLDTLKAHLVAPHMHDYRTRVKELVIGTELQVLAPA